MRHVDHPPLIREDHPIDYDGYPFITLLQYRKDTLLTIVDNVIGKQVYAFVLDLCGPADIDESKLLEVASEWYDHRKHPLSVEFAKRNLTQTIAFPTYKKFTKDFILRAIGPLFEFPVLETQQIRRRKKR